MPKISYGCLISCEKTISLFIQNLNRDNQIILKILDDTHLLIKQDKLSYVQEMVYNMQDTNVNKEIKVSKYDIF
jgi:hypothetical protein